MKSETPWGPFWDIRAFWKKEEWIREEAKDYLKRIEKEIERINRIVRELFDFARPSKFEIREVEINKVIENTLSLLSYQKNFKNIETQLDLQPDLPLIKGDESQLSQVFINMIFNAIDAMPEGGMLQIQTGGHVVEYVFIGSFSTASIRRDEKEILWNPIILIFENPIPFPLCSPNFQKGTAW